MDVSKIYLRKAFFIIILFVLTISAVLNAAIYFCLNSLSLYLSSDAGGNSAVDILSLVSENFFFWVVPGITGVLLLSGGVLWLGLKFFAVPDPFQRQSEKSGNAPKQKSKNDFVSQKIEQDRKRRLFLHGLAVLQREGRLLDFFQEDLSLYEDQQIGATVRSIQEDCKKAVRKYIDPKPVTDQQEGERIIIEPGFDIDSIVLVGNVSGQPPFEGIVKHRGWKAGKNEIPKLSDIRDASVIVPAEVEVQ